MIFVLRKRNIALFFIGLFFFGLSWSTYTLAIHPNMKNWHKEKILISKVETSQKVVALTYDDGPDAKNTSAVLDALKAHKARATFFVLGKRAEQDPEMLKRIKLEGHEIGNHGYSHADFNRIGNSAILQEIVKTNQIIHSISGDTAVLFRPPGGYLSNDMVAMCRNEKLTIAYWTYQQDSKDWRNGVQASQIANHIIPRIEPGQIIVLHDGAPNGMETARATGLIISALEKQGYRFVTMSELIALGNKE